MTTSNIKVRASKGYKGMAMEGPIATWYAQNTIGRREANELLADRLSKTIAPGSRVLEVAPGPGYLTIALAQFGKYNLTGLDISKSFVEIAQGKAREVGVNADFRLGNASDMPFEAAAFDFIVCQAAFKNFAEPVKAIREMYRVLKPGGKALIIDLRRDASREAITKAVNDMGLNWINSLITKWAFRQVLLKSAYTKEEIRQFVSQTSFGQCEIRDDAIGMAIWLNK